MSLERAGLQLLGTPYSVLTWSQLWGLSGTCRLHAPVASYLYNNGVCNFKVALWSSHSVRHSDFFMGGALSTSGFKGTKNKQWSGRSARSWWLFFLHYQIIGWWPAKPDALCPGFRKLMQRDQLAGSENPTWRKENIHRIATYSGEFYNAVPDLELLNRGVALDFLKSSYDSVQHVSRWRQPCPGWAPCQKLLPWFSQGLWCFVHGGHWNLGGLLQHCIGNI